MPNYNILNFTVLHCFQFNCHFTTMHKRNALPQASYEFPKRYSLWTYKTCSFSEFPLSPQNGFEKLRFFFLFLFKYPMQKETDSKHFCFAITFNPKGFPIGQGRNVRAKILNTSFGLTN